MSDQPPTSPSSTTPSSITLAPLAASLSRRAVEDVAAVLPLWLETVRLLQRQPGIQVAIWHDGEVVAEVAAGTVPSAAGPVPLRPTHRLRIASHSKMLTAMLILRLREQRLLRLDDTVGQHVEELADSPVADRTLRDLLSHAAGISRDGDDARFWRLGAAFPDREQLLGIARRAASVAEPGVHLQYSNIGYGLLGLVAEAVTGQDFAASVRERVLDPVGVEGIGPDLPQDAPGPLDPAGFAPGRTSLLHGERRPVEQISTGALASATGFWASAGAIASLAGTVLSGDGPLGTGSVREMRRRVWTLEEGGHYGLGLQEGELHGFTVVGHSGGFPTGLSRTWVAPTERLAVSVIGSAVDAPSSAIAQGVLGLLSLAAGRPAPRAQRWEAPGAQGGGGSGRARPEPLAQQEGATVPGLPEPASAEQLGELVAGSYDSLWGRTRVAVLGGRLLAWDDTAQDPAAEAVELAIGGVRADPIVAGTSCIELAAWGDAGYGTWAEPILARLGLPGGEAPQGAAAALEDAAAAPGGAAAAPGGVGSPPALRCSALIRTGQVLTPTADFVMPERVEIPR